MSLITPYIANSLLKQIDQSTSTSEEIGSELGSEAKADGKDSQAEQEDGDLECPAKRQKLISAPRRFPEPTSDEQLAEASRPPPLVEHSKNTRKCDKWAMSTFREWMSQRNERCKDRPDELCPEDILETGEPETLSKWLSLFIIEARKQDGRKYPSSSLHSILSALQRIMRRSNTRQFNIFELQDARFQQLHRTMANVFEALQKEDHSSLREIRSIKVITSEEEALLWQRGILGDTSPVSLVRSVFFLNGKNFFLGGGKEHRDLRLSQFTRKGDHWEFIANRSKNVRLGGTNVRQENRVFQQYPSPAAGRTCHFYLLDLYFSKLPPSAKQKDVFYYTPVHHLSTNPNQPWWYTDHPIGWNRLDRFVKDMFQEAGIAPKTNHCLKLTGLSQNLVSKVVNVTPGTEDALHGGVAGSSAAAVSAGPSQAQQSTPATAKLTPQVSPLFLKGYLEYISESLKKAAATRAKSQAIPPSAPVNVTLNKLFADSPVHVESKSKEASTSTASNEVKADVQASCQNKQSPPSTSRESAPKDHQSSSESVVSDNISKTTTPSVEALNKELIELRQQFLKSKEGDTEEQGRRNSLTTQDAVMPLFEQPHPQDSFFSSTVTALLEAKGLQQYREVFEREHIDGEILQELDDEILEKDLGVTSKLHRIRIMKLGRDFHSPSSKTM